MLAVILVSDFVLGNVGLSGVLLVIPRVAPPCLCWLSARVIENEFRHKKSAQFLYSGMNGWTVGYIN